MTKSQTAPQKDQPQGERIAKALSRLGVASRRDAEKLVDEGRVHIKRANAPKREIVTHPSTLVDSQTLIYVDGKPLAERGKARMWLYNKPVGLLTTHKDPQNRPTVFENLPKELGRVISVGRLDLNSEGLLLLTNDGEIARYLESPATDLKRVYKVRVFGDVTPAALERLEQGRMVDGVFYGKVKAHILPQGRDNPRMRTENGRNTWIEVELREGKNREIRKIMESLGLRVNRLIRQSYGPYKLADLERGQVREVESSSVREWERRIKAQREGAESETKPAEGTPRRPRRVVKPRRSKHG